MTSLVSTSARCLLILPVLVALVGCGSSEVKTYRIPGKLVYEDNSPIAGAGVVFQTTIDGKPVAARGVADSEGKFTLTTFADGDGIVEGEHDVAVSPPPAGDGPAPVASAVPTVYSDFTTSGLKTTVTPSTPEIVITIKRG
jgi:hypothetical protein